MNIPGNTAVRYLDAFNKITRKVVGADQHQTEFIYIHHDGTVTLNDLTDYSNADVTSTFDLYPDGSLKAYRYNNTLEGANEYVYIQYAQASAGQQQAFGSSGEFANGPVTSSVSLKDGILETRTFVNGKPVLVEIENFNPEAEVFHLKGTLDAAGIVTLELTNTLHPAGLINTAPGSLVGLLNLNTQQLISDNGIGLVSDNGLGLNLVGQDGGSLISDAGWTFNATNSAALISDNGIGLVGQDGGSLITDYGAGLVGQDGGTLQIAEAANGFALSSLSMMRGYKSYQGPTTFTELPDDHGETAGTAGSIDVGETVEGTLETDGDVDWYAVELQAGREYTFSMNGADSGVAFLEDPRLVLVDANGNPVLVNEAPLTDDDGGIGRDARITFTPTVSGTYHIAASNFGPVNGGTYELSVEVSPTAAFVKSAAPMILSEMSPAGGAPVMAYISAGEYAGGFVLAWIATSDGQHSGANFSDYHLQVQIVTAAGEVIDLDPREQYTTYSPNHAGAFYDADDSDPSIAVFEDGSFVVTYSDNSYNAVTPFGPSQRTTYLKMNADGSVDDNATMIPGSGGAGDYRYGSSGADVVVLNNGDWLTVLHRAGVDGVTENTTTNIQTSLNGTNPDPTEPVGSSTDFQGLSATFQALGISATKFGTGAVAVWTDATGDVGNGDAPNGSAPTTLGVKGVVLSATGSVLATFDVNAATDYAQFIANGSQVADLGNGRFVVAWTSDSAGRVTDSFFRIFSYDGEGGGVAAVTGDIPLGADNLTVDNASIVALPSGGFAVVYSHDGTVYMQAYTESGATSGNQTVVASGGASGTSAVAIEDGRIVVAFHQGGQIKLQHMELNLAPTDITLIDNHINENSAATTVVGTLGTVDANGITDSFTYSIVGGDGLFYISGDELRFDSQSDSVIKSLDHEAAATHSVTIRVTDSAGVTFDKTLTIHVDNVNERPTGLVEDEERVDEDLAVGGLVATLQGIDPDAGTNFSYSLRDENGNALGGLPFEIVGNEIRLTTALDFETRQGYTFYVRVSDGTLATSSYNASGGDVRFVLSVDDVDDTAPHGINLYNNYTESIDEDETVGTSVGVFLANDTDTSDRDDIDYEIVNDDGTFRLERTVDGYASLILNTALDHETDDSVAVTIRASDSNGHYDKTFTFAVDDINEAPVITGGGTRKDISVPVGTSINDILYSIVANDPDGDTLTYGFRGFDGTFFFDMDAQGKMRFESSPGFAATYNFEVYAYDGQYATYQDVRVTVTSSGPANNAPVIYGNASITEEVDENTTQVIMVEAADADFDTLTWSLGGPDASKFKIVVYSNTWVSLEFKVAPDYEAPTDTGTNNVYNVAVIATDSEGDWDSQSIAVQVQNVAETPPSITSNGAGTKATISLKENLLTVTDVNATGTAPITYSISGTDAGDFIIDSSTGALSFRKRPDFEKPADENKDNTYLVTVKASNGSQTDTQALTVKVTNDNGTAKTGSSRPDKLNGTTKEETLSGKEGNDTIKALAGGDTIIGGTGADDLYGGTIGDSNDGAADTFKFIKGDSGTTSSKWDQVYDFVSGIDKIDLSGIDGDPKSGQQDLRFVTKFAAPGSKTDGQFRVVDTGAHVNVEIDINGDKKADMIIQVMNVAKLVASDFVL